MRELCMFSFDFSIECYPVTWQLKIGQFCSLKCQLDQPPSNRIGDVPFSKQLIDLPNTTVFIRYLLTWDTVYLIIPTPTALQCWMRTGDRGSTLPHHNIRQMSSDFLLDHWEFPLDESLPKNENIVDCSELLPGIDVFSMIMDERHGSRRAHVLLGHFHYNQQFA